MSKVPKRPSCMAAKKSSGPRSPFSSAKFITNKLPPTLPNGCWRGAICSIGSKARQNFRAIFSLNMLDIQGICPRLRLSQPDPQGSSKIRLPQLLRALPRLDKPLFSELVLRVSAVRIPTYDEHL